MSSRALEDDRTGASAPAPPAALELRCSKTFGRARALADVGLELRAGEVHALLGHNGSGKSTLVKVLAGYHAPDPGATLRIAGDDVPLPMAPGRARHHGLAFVHQDLGLAEPLTVTENVCAGRFERTWYGRIRWRRERARVQAALDRLGLRIDAAAPVRALSPGERAMVAIARALDGLAAGRGGVLVLDEPTAYLPQDETARLLALIRRVAADGVAVLFVTHRLSEVIAVSDRVTVLRNGEHVTTRDAAGLDEAELIRLIVGYELDALYPALAAPRPDVLLRAERVSGGKVRELSLTLHAGEILGVTGLLGMGWEEIPYLLFGARPARGTLAIADATRDLAGLTARSARRAGLALLPADRQRDSGVGVASVAANLTLPTLERHFRGGRLRHREERRRAERLLHDYDVRPPDPRRALAQLSGGNQQKVLFAKWIETGPRALLLHEPTQGVDVGARHLLFERIAQVARQGVAVLLASSEHEDLAHLCDRVLVLQDGRVTAELTGRLEPDRIAEASLRDASIDHRGRAAA